MILGVVANLRGTHRLGRGQRLAHAEGHEQLLGELLLAESHGAGCDHDALAALLVALGDLLHDGGEASQRQADLVLAGDDGAAQLHHQAARVLKLGAVREHGALAVHELLAGRLQQGCSVPWESGVGATSVQPRSWRWAMRVRLALWQAFHSSVYILSGGCVCVSFNCTSKAGKCTSCLNCRAGEIKHLYLFGQRPLEDVDVSALCLKAAIGTRLELDAGRAE